MNEQQAMDRALTLALKGWGRVSPNPLVGALLLRDGQVVGEGYHAEFGGPHAEVAALGSCPDPKGTTCVVTLEPCAHHGKTPPCADALISAGVRRVVIAIRD
ncbi:MAG: riboflavin biosynthesis protein RibD, partial [Gemmatimonadetes bacterium]|nr:riboflavin biosynthesis protein RibD [Gemmatimonadota bacterium]